MKPRFSREISENLRPTYEGPDAEFYLPRNQPKGSRKSEMIYPAFVFGVAVMVGMLCLANNQHSLKFRSTLGALFTGAHRANPSGLQLTSASETVSTPAKVGASTTGTSNAKLAVHLTYWAEFARHCATLRKEIAATLTNIEPEQALGRAQHYRNTAKILQQCPHEGVDDRIVKLSKAFQLWLLSAAELDESLHQRLIGDDAHPAPATGNWVNDRKKVLKRWDAWVQTVEHVRSTLGRDYSAKWPELLP